jgi:hypothetical protein
MACHVMYLVFRVFLSCPRLALLCDNATKLWDAPAGFDTSDSVYCCLHVLPLAQVPGLLAAAAGDAVRVWQLPARLVEPRAGEAKLLRRLLDSEDVAGLLRAQCLVIA